MKKILLSSLIILAFNALVAQDVDYTELKKQLEEIRKEWNIPGMAVGIVHNGETVFAEGFGTKNATNPNDKVDSKTLFPVASNSKAFTSTAMAMLVKEGKVNWNDPVIKYLPYFEMADNYLTTHMTIADLLSHRSGLKTFSGDLLWYGSSYSRVEVIKRAKHLEPVYDFRTSFGYSNIMYIAAGEVIGKASNSTWDAFVSNRIFTPLGMSSSVTSFNDVPKNANITSPHNHVGDSVFPIEYLNWDNIGAAGAIISNVEDISKWLQFQLNNCIWESDTMVNRKDIVTMRTPHVNFPVPYNEHSPFASRHFNGYGLGWSLFDYQGVKVIGHSGGYDGIISYSCIIPEKDLGFVILTNANSSLYYATLYTLLDAFLYPDNTVNWSKLILPGEKQGRIRKTIKTIEDPNSPSFETKAYLGTYHSKIYGTASIFMEGEQLKLKMDQTDLFVGNLSHYNADVFVISMTKTLALPEGLVSFTIKDNKVVSFKIDIENPDFHFDEFTFIKQ